MHSRLRISLAQLNAGNSSKNPQKWNKAIIAFLVQLKKPYKKHLQKFGWHYLKMEKNFVNTGNSKTSEPHRFKLTLADKFNLKGHKKNITSVSNYYTWKNTKSKYNNSKFKISAPTWNDEFDLPDKS